MNSEDLESKWEIAGSKHCTYNTKRSLMWDVREEIKLVDVNKLKVKDLEEILSIIRKYE